jgi:hypothetical protein
MWHLAYIITLCHIISYHSFSPVPAVMILIKFGWHKYWVSRGVTRRSECSRCVVHVPTTQGMCTGAGPYQGGVHRVSGMHCSSLRSLGAHGRSPFHFNYCYQDVVGWWFVTGWCETHKHTHTHTVFFQNGGIFLVAEDVEPEQIKVYSLWSLVALLEEWTSVCSVVHSNVKTEVDRRALAELEHIYICTDVCLPWAAGSRAGSNLHIWSWPEYFPDSEHAV